LSIKEGCDINCVLDYIVHQINMLIWPGFHPAVLVIGRIPSDKPAEELRGWFRNP